MIKSERLILRAVEPTDAGFMFEIDNDSSAWEYSDTIAPLSRKILRDYSLEYDANPFSAGQLRLIVSLKDGMPVGIIDLYEISAVHRHCYVGIYVSPSERGKGYAEEALSATCRYCFSTLMMEKIAARIKAGNKPSEATFTRAGFCHEATLKRWLQGEDGRSDMLLFTIAR